MSRPRAAEVRSLLLANPEGLTRKALSHLLCADPKVLTYTLNHTMPDAYIDRWAPCFGDRGKLVPVWCCVPVPEHCPKPDSRTTRQKLNHKEITK